MLIIYYHIFLLTLLILPSVLKASIKTLTYSQIILGIASVTEVIRVCQDNTDSFNPQLHEFKLQLN